MTLTAVQERPIALLPTVETIHTSTTDGRYPPLHFVTTTNPDKSTVMHRLMVILEHYKTHEGLVVDWRTNDSGFVSMSAMYVANFPGYRFIASNPADDEF